MGADGQIRRVRFKFERDFTQIPNEWLRDARLTLKARGLLAQLMSHDVGFTVSIRSLAQTNPEGRTAIDAAVHELKSNGYLEHEIIRGRHGRIDGVIWQLTDPAEVAKRHAEQPQLDLPDAGKPDMRKNRQPDNLHLKEAHREEHSSSGLPTGVSTRAGADEDALTGADPLEAIWQKCPVTGGAHRFSTEPGAWCDACARVRSDGSVYDLNGRQLREPIAGAA